ncbi:MAG: SEC-C domain-containing protein [Chitinophagaceae bacterium]|nr:SEC-C domain-containing protein [Chitinophagaceae bacterium]
MSIEKDIGNLLQRYPKLRSQTVKKKHFITGEVDIFDDKEIYWDSYSIRVIVTSEYPYSFPTLFETSQKIPKVDYRHIHPDGSCCVTVLQREILYSRRGINLCTYFEKFVIPYFANQLFFEKEGRWASGEYEHGTEGILQFYLEDNGARSFEEIIDLLTYFDDYNICGRNDDCKCGSKRKFKKCHYDIIKFLSLFPAKQRLADLIELNKLLLKRKK